MPLSLNSNPAATAASFNLSRANDALRRSLARLSSGSRIVESRDDPGGMSVAYKLNSRLRRTEAVRQNVQNGISFLQVQDGALQSAGSIVSRMSELRSMAQDVTKNAGDVENYSKEFLELQKQLSQIWREKFNGVELFAISSSQQTLPPDRPALFKGNGTDENGDDITNFSRRIFTHDGGQAVDGNVSVGVTNFEDVFKLGALDTRYVDSFSGRFANLANAGELNVTNYSTVGAGTASSSASSTTSTPQSVLDESLSPEQNAEVFNDNGFLSSILFVSMGQFTSVIERIADARAENGAEQNRMLMVDELLASNMTNLEAAYGRIMDVDVALESTRLAQHNVRVQAAASMVAQANQLSNIALTLLGR
jgi:flagellin-like hook-associated protein FlgL